MLRQRVRATFDAEGRQVVNITIRNGYHPASIVARAGIPLRLVLTRDEQEACSERVIFSAPRLDRRISLTGTTTIELPAQPPGQVRFTCGMGRYRGRIDLVDDEAPSILGRAGRWISSKLSMPAHDPVHLDAHAASDPPSTAVAAPGVRRRWLLPAALGTVIVGGLLAGGFVSLSTALYAGLIGGMLLMHAGGHGHGGPGRHGRDHEGGGGSGSGSASLSKGSSNAQPEMAGSVSGFEPRAVNRMMENGNHDHDRHSSSSCHSRRHDRLLRCARADSVDQNQSGFTRR